MWHTAYPPEKLRELRRRALLTQADVERMTRISRRSVIKLERGHTRPRYSTLSRLLTLYGTCINTIEQRERTWGTGEEQTGAPPAAQAVGTRRTGGSLHPAFEERFTWRTAKRRCFPRRG